MDLDDVIIPDEGTEITVDTQQSSDNNLPAWQGFVDDDSVELADDVVDDEVPEGGEGTGKTTFDDRTGDILDENGVIKKGAQQDPEAEVYLGVADILKKQGFFAGIEDISTIKSPEELAAAFDAEVQARLTDRQRELLEYQNQGVPIAKVSKLQTALEEANSITPEVLEANPNLIKSLIISDLTFKGVDEVTAERVYTAMQGSQEDKIEAMKALEARRANLSNMINKEVNTAKESAKAKADAQLAAAQELEKQLSVGEVFGRKISPITIEKVKKLAGTPVAYTESGEPLNAVMKYKLDNPVDFEHKLVYLFAATNGFKDLNSFDRSAESRVSNSMRNAVKVMSSGEGISNQRLKSKSGTTINIDDIDDII